MTFVLIGEAGNWLIGQEAAQSYPDTETDEVWFTNGTYTVTLHSDHKVKIVEATRVAECGPATKDRYVTIDLNGHELEAAQRFDVSIRTYQFQGTVAGVPGWVKFTNGTVRCSADAALGKNGSDAAYASASGYGVGLPWDGWADRVRGDLILSGLGTTGVIKQVQVNSAQGAVRVDDGAALVVADKVHISGSSGMGSNCCQICVSGAGSHLSCAYIYSSGAQYNAALFEKGAEADVGYITQGVDQSAKTEGGWTIVRSGAKLNLTNVYSGACYRQHQGGVKPQHFLLSGEGSEVNLTYESSTKGEPKFLVGNYEKMTGHTLDVLDGAKLTGTDNSSILLGSNSTNNYVTIDDSSLTIGYVMSGPTYWSSGSLGLASNNVVKIGGRRGKLVVKGSAAYSNAQSGGAGALNLNYNTALVLSVPEQGFAETPVQVPNGVFASKGSTIPGYEGTPGCNLVLNARAWSRKNKGKTQTLVMTAKDSTAALQTLMDNVTFGDFKDGDELPTLSIETSGTQTSLVLTAPPPKGLLLLLR